MALAAIGAVYIGLFLYYLQATVIRQPYWDMYSYVVRYLQYRDDGAWWSYLWEPHVQHRQIWMRLLTAFDVEAFSGSAYPFIVVAATCQLAVAWLLWRAVRQGTHDGERFEPAALTVMLVLTSVAAVDCAIPMNGIYPQALLGTVTAFVLFDSAGGSGRRIAAMGAAAAAACANAAALIVWPILVWCAWRSRAGRAWMMAVALTGAAFSMAYLYRLPSAALGDAGPLAALGSGDDILRTADYAITYLGLPWTRSAALLTPGRVLGVLLLAWGLWAAIQWGIVRRETSRLERLAVALILFALGTAFLAALGRTAIDGDTRVPVRYSVFVAPLHIGLLLLAWPAVETWRLRAPTLRPATVVAVMAGVLLLAQQVLSGQAAVSTTRAMRGTIDRFIAGEETDEMKTVVFVNLEQARRDWNRIRNAGLYLDVSEPRATN